MSETLNSGDNPAQVLGSKIRATVEALTFKLADIRTAKQDPNSTKRFCASTLKVTVPNDVLADAEKARSDAKLNNVSALADHAGVERNADVFSSSFEFDVQPTDTGDKVFAESEDLGKLKSFYAELLASTLLKSVIEQSQMTAQQATAAQEQQKQAAEATQRSADHEQAMTENQLANQTLTAVWKNLDPDVRARLLDDQRAWIRKKVADCAVAAASASVEATEQDTARLRCDTKATQDRTASFQAQAGV